MNLKDKVVLITGSSQGIGRETALAFAKEGANVIITYNTSKKKGEEVFEECKKLGKCILLNLNVKDNDSIKNCVEKVVDEFGAIDILVNNSGVLVWKSLIEQSDDEINSQIDTNIKGLIMMTKRVLPFLKGQNEGTIINIASVLSKFGMANSSVYCATKFGVRGFTEALAKELPDGIKAFAINPNLTSTNMTNYEGMPPKKVAEVIVRCVKDEIKVNSGSYVDVEDYA